MSHLDLNRKLKSLQEHIILTNVSLPSGTTHIQDREEREALGVALPKLNPAVCSGTQRHLFGTHPMGVTSLQLLALKTMVNTVKLRKEEEQSWG